MEAVSFCKLVPNDYQPDSKQTSFPQLEKLQVPSVAEDRNTGSLDPAELQYALDSIGALSIGKAFHYLSCAGIGSELHGTLLWTAK